MIREIDQLDELVALLPYLLHVPDEPRGADPAAISSFQQYLDDAAVRWRAWQRATTSGRPAAAVLALLPPGATAMVLTPNPGQLGVDEAAQVELTRAALAELRRHPLHYAQALVEPRAPGKVRALEAAGFARLTDLLYFSRHSVYPWVDPASHDGLSWTSYTPERHAEFARTVLATYAGSLDCPELLALRPIDDVLASHQAAGAFDPRWWELMLLDGRAVGCLLLARVAHARLLEIVYLGVVPEARGAGIGSLLMRRAIEHCRAAGDARLVVVVDERNLPARKLYEHFAFEQTATRTAYLALFKGDAPRAAPTPPEM
ncbi:MAG: GNAT family N-acetyltransferase [Phycisphaerae bacterium]